jgi:methyl-accepting chemotaxis protein WspA
MKEMTIGQRLNVTRTVLALLLIIGVFLALGAERIRSDAQQSSLNLERNKDRVYSFMIEMSDGLRGLMLNPADTNQRRRLSEAERNLLATITAIKADRAGDPRLLEAVDKLRDFFIGRLIPFKNAIQTRLGSGDVTRATADYVKTIAQIEKEFRPLSSDFKVEVASANAADAAWAQTVYSLVGFGSIAIVFVGLLVVWRIQSTAVSEPLTQLVSGIEQMRGGDFTRRLSLHRKDEFGVLGDGLNRLADDLSAIVGQVQHAGEQVNVNVAQIASTARAQQVTANEIASTTSWIGSTSKEISATSRELVKTMSEVNAVSEETARLAGSGQAAITRMETTMRQIMDASSAISSKLSVLSEKTGNINTVVTTITKVADQTNLLSLNAAIEAEKAGEYGLGFSVVAMEIRRLADQTAVATYDIEKTVKEMQTAVTAGVMGMEKFSDEARRGVEEIRAVSTQLAQIIQQVQTLSPRFQSVNEGMQSQASGAQQISEVLVQVGESAQKTAESLRQSNIAIEHLNEAARGLQNSVARFKLKT